MHASSHTVESVLRANGREADYSFTWLAFRCRTRELVILREPKSAILNH